MAPRYGLGLSPRVRGNRNVKINEDRLVGSIPACAGEPFALVLKILYLRVYPRVCGGTIPVPNQTFEAMGLSPRVRGNHPGIPPTTLHSGSIPACAGEPGCQGLLGL